MVVPDRWEKWEFKIMLKVVVVLKYSCVYFSEM